MRKSTLTRPIGALPTPQVFTSQQHQPPPPAAAAAAAHAIAAIAPPEEPPVELTSEEAEAMAREMTSRDDGCVQLVLKLIARMCDGQNSELQVRCASITSNHMLYNVVLWIEQYTVRVHSN